MVCMVEFNMCSLTFIFASMFFCSDFRFYLCSYVPVYLITTSFLAYFFLKNFGMFSRISVCSVLFLYIIMIGLLTTVLVYRWLLLCIQQDMLKIEESGQIEQLRMVLNKQTDGIALIEQKNVVLIPSSEEEDDSHLVVNES